MPVTPENPETVPVDPDDLHIVVEFLRAMDVVDNVVDELVRAAGDEVVELPLETVVDAIEVLHDIDRGAGLFVGGIGRALAEPLERVVVAESLDPWWGRI